jgi:ABC-2 type transport system permease protein
MHSLKAGIVNEALKIISRKKAVFFLLIAAILPVAAVPVISRVQSGFGIAAVASADFPLLMLNLYTALFLPLILFMTASDLFAGEIGDKTMRITLTRPISRFKVFVSKHVSMFLYTLLYLTVALASSTISSLFLAEKGDLPKGLLNSAAAYGLAAVPMFTLGVVAVFLVQFFKNGSGALTVCILVYALAKGISFVFPQLTVYSPTAYTDWYQLWIGSSVAAGKIASIFMFLMACSILFFTAGYYMFDKKEF